jgi:Protein of unknown function (DUF2550)
MLIALLVILGVNLIVIVVVASSVLGRRRWLKRQPGAFVGAVRVPRGEIDGFGSKWKRGSGRWVRDVFVWSKAPFMFRSELVAVDNLSGERTADMGEVKRLGDKPAVIELMSGEATVEIAVRPEHRSLAVGPFTTPSTASVNTP